MGKDYQETDWDNWEYNENDNGDELNQSGDSEEKLIFKDVNGAQLLGGETVVATKDLAVKGGQNIKRGDKFKNIKLTDEKGLIESGKMVLKCDFFKKI